MTIIFRSVKHLYHNVCRSSNDFLLSSSAVHGRPGISINVRGSNRGSQGHSEGLQTSSPGKIRRDRVGDGFLEVWEGCRQAEEVRLVVWRRDWVVWMGLMCEYIDIQVFSVDNSVESPPEPAAAISASVDALHGREIFRDSGIFNCYTEAGILGTSTRLEVSGQPYP